MSLPDSEKPSPLYSNQDLSSKSSTLEGSIKEGLSEHDSASIHDDSEYNLTPGISPAAPVPLGEPLSRKATSVQTAGTNSPDFEVDYEENDPLNPREWPICVVVYSTSYTTGLEQMMRDLHVSSEPLVTLGITVSGPKVVCHSPLDSEL
ncbi:MAG: hypothetical protein LQ342_005216 [Letrouitia transgressa]|nr:MAG: hypothetical protein LQ342_005216 [Letrouitia transgressa]